MTSITNSIKFYAPDGSIVSTEKFASRQNVKTFIENMFDDVTTDDRTLMEDLIFYRYMGKAGEGQFNNKWVSFKTRTDMLRKEIAEAKILDEKDLLLARSQEFSKLLVALNINTSYLVCADMPAKETEFNIDGDPLKTTVMIRPNNLRADLKQALSCTDEITKKRYLDGAIELVERIIIKDLNKRDHHVKDTGICDPVSRTIYINSRSQETNEPANTLLLAQAIVHETAHIQWEKDHKNAKFDPKYYLEAERYALLATYRFTKTHYKGKYPGGEAIIMFDKTHNRVKHMLHVINRKLGYPKADL
jgi:hypothetical protein